MEKQVAHSTPFLEVGPSGNNTDQIKLKTYYKPTSPGLQVLNFISLTIFPNKTSLIKYLQHFKNWKPLPADLSSIREGNILITLKSIILHGQLINTVQKITHKDVSYLIPSLQVIKRRTQIYPKVSNLLLFQNYPCKVKNVLVFLL